MILLLCYVHFVAQNLTEYLRGFFLFFFLKSQLKLQILAVVHIFKDYATTFPHNVLQFPGYNTLCPNLKTTYPFFFFLFYNVADSVLIT